MQHFLLARVKYVLVLMLLLAGIQTVVLAQSVNVKGKVLNEKAEPMPSVSVIVKGTTTGVSTNNDGEFSINAPNKNSVLVFSSVGYQSQEITVGNQSNLSIVLKVGEAGQLDAVVVVGYGT